MLLRLQLLLHRGDDANRQPLRRGHLLHGLPELPGALVALVPHNLAQAFLQEVAQARLRHHRRRKLRGRSRGGRGAFLLLQLREDARRARERRLAPLVSSPVEKHANLMVPPVAVIALYPGLLQVVVVFLLGELRFGVLGPLHLDRAVDGVVARVAPRVLPHLPASHVRRDVVIHLPALDPSHATVAVQRRRFERQPLNPARAARLFCDADDGLLRLGVPSTGGHRLPLRRRISVGQS